MKIHELKCWPEYFGALLRGEKRCELRLNDRDFQDGDLLHLRAWNPASQLYVDPRNVGVSDIFVRVLRVWRDLPGLKEGYVIMDIRRLVPEE